MRLAVFGVLVVTALVVRADEEPWVEEEDLEEPYTNEREESIDRLQRDTLEPRDDHERRRREVYYEDYQPIETRERRRREVYVEEPYEHVRVKRCCYDEPQVRVRREASYQRVPRQVHQYEVYESTDEGSAPAPTYEEMLAASAEHYHRVYAAPGAPAPERYADPEVSDHPAPASFVPSNVPYASVKPVPVYNPVPVAQKYVAQQLPQFASHPQKLVQFVGQPQKLVQYVGQPQKPLFTEQKASAPVSVPVAAVKQPAPFAAPVQFVAPPVSLAKAAPVPEVAPAVPADVAPAVSALSDQTPAGAGHHHHHHHKHAHGHAAGGGHHKHAGHHAAHGGKSIKGFNHHQHLDKGAKGHKTDEHHRQEYDESAGKKKKHHDHAGHKGGHEEEAHGHRGAHFDEKKGHKKGHKTKGYHNKYHKDEFHKEHKFYDDFHKSGEHHRYGKFHAKHASNESGKKKAHHVNAGHDFVERGKKGYSNKGHLDADHKGHKGKHGHEEHHEKHSSHGKKGGGEGGKEYGYAKKN